MTSILKVDQIQLADGTAPTAADLGFAGGAVVKTHTLVSPSATDFSVTSSSYSDVDTFTLSTSGSTRLVWFFDTQQYIKSSANSNLQLRLTVDGTVVGTGGSADIESPSFNHNWYGQNAGREIQFNYFVTPTLSAGSHTIKVQAASYLGVSLTLKYQSRGMRYLVQEITV
jgi:hypothetical protein